MKLPNFEQAFVPEAKITRYLLDLTSDKGRHKAAFFLAFGFTIRQWSVMAEALKQHAAVCEVVSTRQTLFGVNYIVEGALATPDGRKPQVRVVWTILDGEIIPSLVTAYPLNR